MWSIAGGCTNSTSFLLENLGHTAGARVFSLAFIDLPFRITFWEVQIAIILVAGVVLLLAANAKSRRRARFRGYENFVEQVYEIRKALKVRVYRQEEDLMLEGRYHHLPVFIRLSHSQYTPGLYVQLPVPSRLALFFVPRKLKDQHQAGAVLLQTPDEQFDARVVTRSDQPVQARMLLASSRAQQQIHKLCFSSNCLVSVSSGLLEVSEPVIPEHDLADHLMGHIRSMAKLAAEVAKLPGAEQVKPAESKIRSGRLLRVMIATGAVLLVVLFFVNRAMQNSSFFKAQIIPAGMLPNDAGLIPNLDNWRLAETSDFDARGVAWLQSKGKQASARLMGRFAGEGFPEESAYVLVSADTRQPAQVRIVLLIHRVVRLDKTYPAIALMTTVPQSNLGAISWRGTPPPTPADGDGLMIVSKYDDPTSASIVYLYQKHVLTAGVPASFQDVSIVQ